MEKGGLTRLFGQRIGLSMKFKVHKRSRVLYLAFCIPFILAYVSWVFFPIFAQWVIGSVFRYGVAKPADWFWLGIVHFFYGWKSVV